MAKKASNSTSVTKQDGDTPLQTYRDVLAHLSKRTVSLLLGNGFSMAYDPKIFSYNALSEFVDTIEDPLLAKLFEIIKTKNFEQVMLQLSNFCELAKEFSDDDQLEPKIIAASDALKKSLLDAIAELHPEHVFAVPEDKSKACAKFLSTYVGGDGHIFTTNYDILLYWVLMRNSKDIPRAVDGFGRDREDDGGQYTPSEDREYSELRWGNNKSEQNVHYLHGALPFFDTGTAVIKEQYDNEKGNLLENIKERIERKEYPVFVTSGNGEDKLHNIRHNQYLTYCYDQLCSINGSLITFGFNFGEYDKHIIEAINKASAQPKESRLWSVYIGVYNDDDQKHIESFAARFSCKVNMFDAKTAAVWGEQSAH